MSQINETTIKSPGVYTTEIPLFPPSVAQVATAIPAFIGYTKKALRSGKEVINHAIRISSLVQYVQYFGESFDNLSATVVLNNDDTVASVSMSPKYQLFNAVQLYFNQGGANCYIISVGYYKPDGSALMDDFIKPASVKCLEVLAKEDEPTLIVIPDAVMLEEPQFNQLMNAALKQCADLQDRFTILDVLNGNKERTFDNDDIINKFRNGIVASNLTYGAAYYPWLRTSIPYTVSYSNIKAEKPAGNSIDLNMVITANPFLTQLDKAVADKKNIINPFFDLLKPEIGNLANKTDLGNRLKEIKSMLKGLVKLTGFTDITPAAVGGATVKDKFDQYIKPGSEGVFTPIEKLMRELLLIDNSYPVPIDTAPHDLGKSLATDFTGYQVAGVTADIGVYRGATTEPEAIQNISGRVKALYSNAYIMVSGFKNEIQNFLESLEQSLVASSSVYVNIKTAVKREGIIVPPSGAIAGVYAAVDGTRGVWKAPANVGLTAVIEPLVVIDNNIQDDLNIDVNGGKSINVIRSFSGKGTLVWGARTMAGNDNEWRYVSVRRLFIMVEESAKKATIPFVFEPNDANTWVKIRAMLENFLTILWRQGALAGAKPEHAFFVKCGLGQTMTAEDILEGRLIIEIGMAAVRPAEFIILRFSHKMQES